MKKTNKRTKRVPFLCLQGTFLCTEGLPVKKKKKKKDQNPYLLRVHILLEE